MQGSIFLRTSILGLCSLVWSATAVAGAFKADFDTIPDGAIHASAPEWRLLSGNGDAFSVVDGAGRSGEMGDKALHIVYAGPGNLIALPGRLAWGVGETWSIEFDFRLVLDAAPVPETREMFILAMGGEGLAPDGRWVEALGTEADGEWCWAGGGPAWKVDSSLPADRFLQRPASGISTSSWFHLRFSSLKKDLPGAFENELVISDSAGRIVQRHNCSTLGTDDARQRQMWRLQQMVCGLGMGRAQPGGSVYIDNLALSSRRPGRRYECHFNDYETASLSSPGNWAVMDGSPEAFFVDKGEGYSGFPDDKALRIDFREGGGAVLCPASLGWLPGETFSLEFDFKLALDPGPVQATTELFTLLVGDPSLEPRKRWIQALGIQPDDRWSWIGMAPDLAREQDLAPGAFIRRPADARVESHWFHARLVSRKSTEPNTFESEFTVRDPVLDADVFSHRYATQATALPQAGTVWNRQSITFGFGLGTEAPHGTAWIDNIRAVVLPVGATGDELNESISDFVLNTIRKRAGEQDGEDGGE